MDLMVIATGLQLIKLITFVVSKLFMLLSLSYNDFVKVTSQIAYVYFIRLSSLRVCSQASNKCNGDLKQLVQKIEIYMPSITVTVYSRYGKMQQGKYLLNPNRLEDKGSRESSIVYQWA